jgi:uncharacterized membrane protein
MNDRRYTFLPILIAILRVLGAFPIVLGLFAMLAGATTFSRSQTPMALAVAILVTAGPILIGILFMAAAELLKVLMDIEGNTRRSAEELETVAMNTRAAVPGELVGL